MASSTSDSFFSDKTDSNLSAEYIQNTLQRGLRDKHEKIFRVQGEQDTFVNIHTYKSKIITDFSKV